MPTYPLWRNRPGHVPGLPVAFSVYHHVNTGPTTNSYGLVCPVELAEDKDPCKKPTNPSQRQLFWGPVNQDAEVSVDITLKEGRGSASATAYFHIDKPGVSGSSFQSATGMTYMVSPKPGDPTGYIATGMAFQQAPNAGATVRSNVFSPISGTLYYIQLVKFEDSARDGGGTWLTNTADLFVLDPHSDNYARYKINGPMGDPTCRVVGHDDLPAVCELRDSPDLSFPMGSDRTELKMSFSAETTLMFQPDVGQSVPLERIDWSFKATLKQDDTKPYGFDLTFDPSGIPTDGPKSIDQFPAGEQWPKWKCNASAFIWYRPGTTAEQAQRQTVSTCLS